MALVLSSVSSVGCELEELPPNICKEREGGAMRSELIDHFVCDDGWQLHS